MEMFDADQTTQARVSQTRPSQAAVRPGRTLRMALIAAGSTVVISLMVSGTVSSRLPSFKGGRAAHPIATSTLFYHASFAQTLHGSGDGRIYLDAKVSGHTLRFRVDPAVSEVLLSADDARIVGLSKHEWDYSGHAMTSVGQVRTARVTIPDLQFGTLTLFNVEAAVTDSALTEPILGMSFLKRFQSFDLRQGDLVLRW